jgi:microcystin degradation protein MlrC
MAQNTTPPHTDHHEQARQAISLLSHYCYEARQDGIAAAEWRSVAINRKRKIDMATDALRSIAEMADNLDRCGGPKEIALHAQATLRALKL